MKQSTTDRMHAKCAEVIARGKQLYGIDMSVAKVVLSHLGGSAGRAWWKLANGSFSTGIKLNQDMLEREETVDAVINDTIPHEYAHVLCYMSPTHGNGHNIGWRNVCIALGGTGETRHDMDVVYAKGGTYEYTSTTGHAVRLSLSRHKRVLTGEVYTFAGKGTIKLGCKFVVVGQAGRTFSDNATIVQATAAAITDVPRKPQAAAVHAGHSKASVSRAIMLRGIRNKTEYETVIAEMITACGYTRQLARATYKANEARVLAHIAANH